jgi:hypothetical protein
LSSPLAPRGLYPDLETQGAIFAEDDARLQIETMPRRWSPSQPLRIRPDYALAVVGVMALCSALRIPAGWSGTAMHSHASDLAGLLRQISYAERERKGDAVALLETQDRTAIMECRHLASRLWAGQVTAQKIWSTNAAALDRLWLQHEERRQAAPEDDDSGPLSLEAVTDTMVSCTGYDRSMVGRPLDHGFSPAAVGIAIIGARPAIEMYSFIGAAVIEAAGRWIMISQPQIPDLTGIALRDMRDCRRLIELGAPLPLSTRLAGKRSYLAPGARRRSRETGRNCDIPHDVNRES